MPSWAQSSSTVDLLTPSRMLRSVGVITLPSLTMKKFPPVFSVRFPSRSKSTAIASGSARATSRSASWPAMRLRCFIFGSRDSGGICLADGVIA